jgi:predicted DNA-binding protein
VNLYELLCLTLAFHLSTLKHMEVHFTPDVEAKLNALATETGRATAEFVQDAMAGYLEELADVRDTLDRRYDDIKSGKGKPIDGEAFFESLCQREETLLKKQSPQ